MTYRIIKAHGAQRATRLIQADSDDAARNSWIWAQYRSRGVLAYRLQARTANGRWFTIDNH